MNAVKANAKRAWMLSKGYDLDQADHKNEVLEEFRDEVVDNLTSYVHKLKQTDYSVKLYFALNHGNFEIIIQNNVQMTPAELERAKQRIEWAQTADNLFEGYTLFNDNREGAGLGLAMNLLLLKQAGLGPENFRINSNNNSTTVYLTIPDAINSPVEVMQMQDRITSEIETIPEFPETIQKIISLCDNPKSGLKEIASQIELSPSLAASIMKTANSPAYRREKNAQTIAEACSVLGIKLIRELSTVFAAREILSDQYDVFHEFWDHAQKCAYYAKRLAELTDNKKYSDNAYLGGLLHDIGKIILYAIDPKVIEEINGLIIDRTQNSTARLEEVAMGVSHALLGGTLAEKWNFADSVVEMIKFHHSPFLASDDQKKQVSIIHLADALIRAEEGKRNYVHFDLDAMAELGIEKQSELSAIHDQIIDSVSKGEVA